MGKYVDYYCGDNNKELKKLVNPILMNHFGWLPSQYYDDFYSILAQVVWDCEKNFNEQKVKTNKFKSYLLSCISNKIKSQLTHMHRDKRCLKDDEGNPVYTVSLDSPVGDDEKITIGDTIQSDFDIDEELQGVLKDEKLEKFLNNLPRIQRQIAEMIMEGFSIDEIKQRLKLSDKKYHDNFNALKLFKNISILCNDQNQIKIMEDEEMSMTTQTQTAENCKTDKISIASIIKKIDKHTIRFDHPLQRESDQWSPSMKGNLVSDILQGNKLQPLIFAEQIINGVPIIWDLDGKQRCTNVYLYSKNGYKVSKNIRRWMIKYQTTEKDENGNDVLDENGFPIAVNAEFDIRGKKFSDLPEELRDRFLDYSFNYDQYLNCSEEDIGYHIERYNDGKTMTKPQKGITKIGTEFAEMVKSISNMSFFKNIGGYKVSEFKNGAIDRVVIESVMATNYFDDWKKDMEKQCEYLKENATSEIFDNFEDMVERLEKVITDDVADMFDSKDSFLYFGLFSKFINIGLNDEKFIEFMAEFTRSLHSKEIDGITYDELCVNPKTGKAYGTKDKYIVIPKMERLENLMFDFLNISRSKIKNGVDKNILIANYVDMSIEEISQDIDFYEDTLDELENKTIKDGSKLLEPENRVSLLAMIVYSFKNDVDLDDWMEEYAKSNNMYFPDQRKNFLYMKKDFINYIETKEKAG